MFIITAILSTRLLLPLKELHDIFFQPLIKIKVLVAAVFFQHHGYIDLTVLIPRQFVAELFVMLCQALYLLLAFTTQHRTYRDKDFQHYTIHDMVSLDIKIGIVRSQSQTFQLRAQLLHPVDVAGETGLQLGQLCRHRL